MDHNHLKVILVAFVYLLITMAFGVSFLAGIFELYKWGLEETFKGYYNETVANVRTPPKYAYSAICLFVTSAMFCVGVSVIAKSKIERQSLGKITNALVLKICYAVFHFIFLYFLMEIIEFSLDVPWPYFTGYKKIFCTVNGELSTISSSPVMEVNQLCQPFPSFFCAAMTFCTVYLSRYLKRHIIPSSATFLQHFAIVIIGNFCVLVFITLYTDGHMYLGDIGLGVLFGALHTLIMMRTGFIKSRIMLPCTQDTWKACIYIPKKI